MPIPAYRAKQSTDTSGTGTVVLNAAATNARSFNAAFGASARRVMYAISWATGFELGLGDFDGGTPGSLTRATVLASSNAGALVTLPAGTKDVFAVFDPAAREVISISATATLALADLGNAVVFTGSSAASLNLPAVATAPLGAGWLVMNTGTAALTIDPNGAEQVNGAATLVLQPGQSAQVLREASAWRAAVMMGPNVTGNLSVSGEVQSTGPIRMQAGTALLPAITPTGDPDTGIVSPGPNQLALAANGALVWQVSDGVAAFLGKSSDNFSPLYMQNNGASGSQAKTLFIAARNENSIEVASVNFGVNTDGGSQIDFLITPAGARTSDRRVSRMIVTSGGVTMSNGLNVTGGLQFDGKNVGINRGTEQATTSGVSIDFTSIPAGVRRVIVMLNGVSTNGSSLPQLQVGSGSIVTSGYAGGYWGAITGGNPTSGFIFNENNSAGDIRHGNLMLCNISGNTWVYSGTVGLSSFSTRGTLSYGTIALGGVLDRLRITTVNGTDTFDAGAVNIMWEF
jgi:hypothetical protein